MNADSESLLQAMASDELAAFLPPVVELRTGVLSRFEVLARWQHPEAGLVLPDNLISLAEHE
jgi:EAL domain-containing protein (putative c-di-GMP-specific phosphodiesterase class I)